MKAKILKDFLEAKRCKSLEDFAFNWVEERKKLDCELNYSPQYVVKLLRDGLNKGSITKTKSRGGGEKLVDEEVLKCLICTVFDFPDATDEERTIYLNKYVPCQEDNIRIKTVNRILNENLIKTKVPYFSFKERNRFSALVLRYLWAHQKEEITKKTYTLFILVDEAGVLLGKYKKRARVFYSVVSMVNNQLPQRK